MPITSRHRGASGVVQNRAAPGERETNGRSLQGGVCGVLPSLEPMGGGRKNDSTARRGDFGAQKWLPYAIAFSEYLQQGDVSNDDGPHRNGVVTK